MLVDPYESAEILLPASSRPILLQLSLWDGICAGLRLSDANLYVCRHIAVRGMGIYFPWLASWV